MDKENIQKKNLWQKFVSLFDPRDLTKGKIFPVLRQFRVPIILSRIFQQIYSLTDAVIVGKYLNANQVAAVNDTIPVVGRITNFAIGCTAGFSVVISKATGEGDEEKARKAFVAQLFLSIVLTIAITIACYFLIDPVLSWIKIDKNSTDPARQEIYKEGFNYIFINLVFGFFSQMLYNLIVSSLRAIGDSLFPFLFLVGGTALNILGDFLLIVVFPLGVSGSAIATVACQCLTAIIATIYFVVRYKQFRMQKKDLHFNWKEIGYNLKRGLPLGRQASILSIGVIIRSSSVIPFDRMVNGGTISGNPAQVGYGVANKLSGIRRRFQGAIGTGRLSFISQNRGAKKYDRIKEGFKVGGLMEIITTLFLILFGYLVSINGGYLYLFLSKDKVTEDVIRFGNTYLYTILPFYLFLGGIFFGRNCIQALEKPRIPLLGGIAELLTRTIVCLFLPQLVNHGPINANASLASYISVCLADSITWIVSCLIVRIPTVVRISKLLKSVSNPSKASKKEPSKN